MDVKEIEFSENELVTIQYQRLMNFIVVQQDIQAKNAELERKLSDKEGLMKNMEGVLNKLVSDQSDENFMLHVKCDGVSGVRVLTPTLGAPDPRPIIKCNL